MWEQKPRIIGTKIATKVLKDGQLTIDTKEVVWGYLNEGDIIIIGIIKKGDKPTQATGFNPRQFTGGIIR